MCYQFFCVFRDGPNIIYTKEMQLQEAFANKHKEYIDDLENGYDRIATLHYNRREHDNDSIRRHEIDRGSDVGVFHKSDDKHDKTQNVQDKTHAPTSLGRDQFFIKDGNTEILRLVTRGNNEEERYVNLPIHQQRPVTIIPHTQYVVVDSGKDLLMERFIREQGEEAKNIRERMSKITTDLDNMSGKDVKSYGQRSQVGSDVIQHQYHDYTNLPPEVPGAVPLKAEMLQTALLEMQNKSSINQELLESSLRKQNELLHQILIERERIMQNHETASQIESKMETQSLPGHSVIATQTECHIGTQTESQLLKPSRRKARSDNDSYSEDDSQIMVEDDETKKTVWIKRKKPKKKIKYKDPRRSIRAYDLKRKIKTPILEESEISPSFESEKYVKVSKTNEREERVKNYGDRTKSVVTTSKNETVSSTQIKLSESEKKARQRILMEISDSLEDKIESDISDKRLRLQRQSPVAIEAVTSKLALEHESSKDSKSQSSSASGKVGRNLVFSRQGSSTEARDEAELLKLKSPDIDEQKSKNETTSSNESSKKRTNETESVKSDTKPAQKSVPRYMQWYGKKSAQPSKQPAPEKAVPSKPKRGSKLKNDDDKTGRYGKIITKENQASEAKKNFKLKENEFIHPRLLKEEKVTPVPEGPLPGVHPLLQHSEHRYEHNYENQNPLCYIQPTHIPKYLGQPNVPLPRRQSDQPIYVNQDDVKNKEKQEISESALTHSISISTSYEEDIKNAPEVHVSKINIGGDTETSHTITSKVEDNDSGIAMNTKVQQTGNVKRLPITEKKSVFRIAYDDVQTKQLRPDSSSTSY